CGLDAYGFPPRALEISVIAFCARTLLPASSRGGETTAIPNFPGDTAMSPPPTPLFPGNPVAYNHLPESSYRPAVAITAQIPGILFASITTFPVTGFFPPLASVPAIVARSFAFTPMEHCLV